MWFLGESGANVTAEKAPQQRTDELWQQQQWYGRQQGQMMGAYGASAQFVANTAAYRQFNQSAPYGTAAPPSYQMVVVNCRSVFMLKSKLFNFICFI